MVRIMKGVKVDEIKDIKKEVLTYLYIVSARALQKTEIFFYI